tara:strand:+ start:182 stop:301 length:120 start_codon:yes stop_codon:yes gene_type:complete
MKMPKRLHIPANLCLIAKHDEMGFKDMHFDSGTVGKRWN